MLERKLLGAAMRSREAFTAIYGSVAHATLLEEPYAPIMSAIEVFYNTDDAATQIDPDIVAARVAKGSLSPKRGRENEILVREIWDEGVSVENVKAYILDLARDRAAMALASALAGRKPEPEVREALEAYQESLGAVLDDTLEEAEGFSGLVKRRASREGRMLLSPRRLNEYIGGGVLPGHNITIFGRPESGKTALAITIACGFARRGLTVLYIGNEDPVQDLMVRMITNLTGKTLEEMVDEPDRWEREALAKGGSRLIVKATAPGSIPEIEALIKRHKPNVLIVDQLRNITSGKSDNFTQLLDKNAQAVRSLGKRYGLVTVSITQAGDSASGRSVLDMGDVDSSNTGIPGAADLMIGVGVTEALDKANQRVLSLCKNKLGGLKAQVTVEIDPFRSKMK